MQVNKRLRVFAGPDGSGKSTLLMFLKRISTLGIFVNADKLEKLLNNSSLIDLNAFDISAIPKDLRLFKTKETEDHLISTPLF